MTITATHRRSRGRMRFGAALATGMALAAPLLLPIAPATVDAPGIELVQRSREVKDGRESKQTAERAWCAAANRDHSSWIVTAGRYADQRSALPGGASNPQYDVLTTKINQAFAVAGGIMDEMRARGC